MLGAPVKAFHVLFASCLAWSAAYAHGDHEAKHGGIMSRGDELVSAELVVQKDGVVIYLETEDGHRVPTGGVSGTLTLSGPQRPGQEAKLIPGGDNKLVATGLKPVHGDRLNAFIRLPSGEEARLIFSITR
jgi:hypothetical protein